jgi:fructose-specific phosphotransferase system IIC component
MVAALFLVVVLEGFIARSEVGASGLPTGVLRAAKKNPAQGSTNGLNSATADFFDMTLLDGIRREELTHD